VQCLGTPEWVCCSVVKLMWIYIWSYWFNTVTLLMLKKLCWCLSLATLHNEFTHMQAGTAHCHFTMVTMTVSGHYTQWRYDSGEQLGNTAQKPHSVTCGMVAVQDNDCKYISNAHTKEIIQKNHVWLHSTSNSLWCTQMPQIDSL
jgi:hypothetical protein